jgi:hypothetical protein
MTNDDRGLEDALISVWRQVLVEEAKTVIVEGRDFSVRGTSRSKLREVDFRFDGHELRGLEQNPATCRYIAVVVDGKVRFYGKAALDELKRQV